MVRWMHFRTNLKRLLYFEDLGDSKIDYILENYSNMFSTQSYF